MSLIPHGNLGRTRCVLEWFGRPLLELLADTYGVCLEWVFTRIAYLGDYKTAVTMHACVHIRILTRGTLQAQITGFATVSLVS